jgi:phosphoglucosamine mutase
MKIFGDDGFRDIFGSNLLNQEFLNQFFNNLNFLLENKKIKKIVIGYDNRISKKYIINIILKNINIVKKILFLKNPISTPGLQYLSKKEKCFGIMITASHFPAKYNGFKFFINGSKLMKKDEVYLEKKIFQKKKYNFKQKNKYKIEKINGNEYVDFLNIKHNSKLNKKILIDGSNGSVSFFKNKLEFFKNSKLINFEKDGRKINKNCGTNYFAKNINKNEYKKYDFSIAYDGDADRFLVAEKNYGLIETEKTALIFATFFLKQKKIKSIVMTEITNPWFFEEIKKLGIKKIISKVGDRNVIDKVKKNKSFFGYETSGHFSFMNSMDGILSSILFAKIISKNQELIFTILKKNINYKKSIYGILPKNIKKIKNHFVKKNIKIKFIFRKSIWNSYYKLYLFFRKEDVNDMEKIRKYLFNKSLKVKIKN